MNGWQKKMKSDIDNIIHEIKNLICDLLINRNILEKIGHESEFEKGLFRGKINQINGTIDRLSGIIDKIFDKD
jgi:hypothetical protein